MPNTRNNEPYFLFLFCVLPTLLKAYRWMRTLYYGSVRRCAFFALLWHVVHTLIGYGSLALCIRIMYAQHISNRQSICKDEMLSVILFWCVIFLTCLLCVMDSVDCL